ncbi:prepilin-type N-terminal cleavage/methylation domain-containing protein [Desulfobulbus propionicus]
MIRTRTAIAHHPKGTKSSGFTLLEVLVVLTVMGLLAAMVYPAMGYLNNRERERITRQKMGQIRRALVGDPDRFDEAGRRIIGGYVGDMEAWPDLWEAAPQVKEAVTGTPPDFDPEDSGNPSVYYYRPMGRFVAGSWRWGRYPQDPQPSQDFRKLTNAASNSDHIGGLETENEGQPVGLWSDDPGGEEADRLDTSKWKGPYLVRPTDNKPEDSGHLAQSDDQYYRLEPAYGTGPTESWEDGNYAPALPDAGEHGDDKEKFRLLQTDGRLADGWDRAFRFFITSDPDHAGESLFWIISEGADHEATYPTKGTCAATSWTVDPDDRMGTKYDATAADPKGYNPDDPSNQDNIVMTISSAEWRAVLAERNQRRRQQTEALMERVRRALIGTTTAGEDGFNSGYTGALCRWPGLFRWEDAGTTDDKTDDYWDDRNEDTTPASYTKGQPRGLWTDQPNTSGEAAAIEFDRLHEPALTITDPSTTIGTGSGPGIGWHGPYLPPPLGSGADNRLVDGWGQELLFFLDTANNQLLALSRGPDGRFDFGDTDTLPEGAPDGTNDYQEPADWIEAVDVTGYDPNDTNGHNADNVLMILRGTDWRPGWLSLETLSVKNATTGVTKARFVSGVDASGVVQSVLYTAGTDGSLTGTTWTLGPLPEALRYDGTDDACTGARQLVVWQDDGATADAVDSGELHTTINYNLYPHNGHEPRTNLNLDTTTFTAAP